MTPSESLRDLTRQLIERTAAGSIRWEPSLEDPPDRETYYWTASSGTVSVTCWCGRFFELVLADEEGNQVDSLFEGPRAPGQEPLPVTALWYEARRNTGAVEEVIDGLLAELRSDDTGLAESDASEAS